MQGATHFIESFTSKGKLLQGHLLPIKNLSASLKLTASLSDLKTIAVWYIKPKTVSQ